jgi:transcriptional regulator with XRE-family HTH domain
MKIIIDSKNKNIIGPRVKEARVNNDLTQEQLTAKLETLAVYIDRASISKIEQQKRIVTDYELMALSQLLKVSVCWLMGIEE